MTKTIAACFAAITLVIASSAFASPEVSNQALREVIAAKADVSAGRYNQAIERAERAQTTLLNAKQAGDETAPAALDALKDAAKNIMDKKKTDAMGDLDKAASALKI